MVLNLSKPCPGPSYLSVVIKIIGDLYALCWDEGPVSNNVTEIERL